MREHTLDDLRPGDSGRVERLRAGCALGRRLMDLGFTPGAKAEHLFSAPSGDPRAYLICGAVIALRRDDARDVLLSGGANHNG